MKRAELKSTGFYTNKHKPGQLFIVTGGSKGSGKTLISTWSNDRKYGQSNKLDGTESSVFPLDGYEAFSGVIKVEDGIYAGVEETEDDMFHRFLEEGK